MPFSIEDIEPESVRPWRSGSYGLVDPRVGGVVAYFSNATLACTVRDLLNNSVHDQIALDALGITVLTASK
jgi:hypothetical protein